MPCISGWDMFQIIWSFFRPFALCLTSQQSRRDCTLGAQFRFSAFTTIVPESGFYLVPLGIKAHSTWIIDLSSTGSSPVGYLCCGRLVLSTQPYQVLQPGPQSWVLGLSGLVVLFSRLIHALLLAPGQTSPGMWQH